MLEPVQTTTGQQSMQNWNMFAQSGDPKMYLNYKRNAAGKTRKSYATS